MLRKIHTIFRRLSLCLLFIFLVSFWAHGNKASNSFSHSKSERRGPSNGKVISGIWRAKDQHQHGTSFTDFGEKNNLGDGNVSSHLRKTHFERENGGGFVRNFMKNFGFWKDISPGVANPVPKDSKKVNIASGTEDFGEPDAKRRILMTWAEGLRRREIKRRIRARRDKLKLRKLNRLKKSSEAKQRSAAATAKHGPPFVAELTRGKKLYDEQLALSMKRQWENPWSPPPDRFLLAFCQYGEASIRVYCLLNALNYASTLNRTLLVEVERDADVYDQKLILDVGHIRLCYGLNTIMTVGEYLEAYGTHVIVDEVLCANKKACPAQSTWFLHPNVTFNSSLGITRTATTTHINILFGEFFGLNAQELLMFAGESLGKVLFMGEFHNNELLTENPNFDIPIARSAKCKSNVAILPDPRILQAGIMFVKDMFRGEEYMAVHLRRSDFLTGCIAGQGCRQSVRIICSCLKQKLKMFNLRHIFMSTNSSPEEQTRLWTCLTDGDVSVVQVDTAKREDREWARPLIHAADGYRALFAAELDKVICAYSTAFVGTWHSVFTNDIQRLRYGFQTANSRDSFLCEDPNQ